MTGKSYGIGLIGCGAFGEFCLEAFGKLQNAHVAAVADQIAQAARRLGDRFDVPAFRSAGELIGRDDVDIVHVATPPSSHHRLVLDALNAGKHVLCEKPLAMTREQAREVVAAGADGVIVGSALVDLVAAGHEAGDPGDVGADRLTGLAREL